MTFVFFSRVGIPWTLLVVGSGHRQPAFFLPFKLRAMHVSAGLTVKRKTVYTYRQTGRYPKIHMMSRRLSSCPATSGMTPYPTHGLVTHHSQLAKEQTEKYMRFDTSVGYLDLGRHKLSKFTAFLRTV